MKKYLCCLFALALAIGFSAFNAHKIKNYTIFEYTGDNDSDLNNLELWIGVEEASECEGLPQTACRVIVPIPIREATFETELSIGTLSSMGDLEFRVGQVYCAEVEKRPEHEW